MPPHAYLTCALLPPIARACQAEYRALNDVFPQSSLRMNSTKSMIGHLLGGAGAVEAVATIKAIETGGCAAEGVGTGRAAIRMSVL